MQKNQIQNQVSDIFFNFGNRRDLPLSVMLKVIDNANVFYLYIKSLLDTLNFLRQNLQHN